MKSIYLIGSLRNPVVPVFANKLQALGFECFADWFSPGPRADDYLRDYAKIRGLDYKQTLQSYAAKHIFEFDFFHITRCDIGILLMPAGKSCHIEMGFMRGQGKSVYVLFDKIPKRVDIMYQFATEIFFNEKDLFSALQKERKRK